MNKIINLERSYTTPEQTKRLLELGMPADSADCYIENIGWGDTTNILVDGYPYSKMQELEKRTDPDCTIMPCWSLGRLIQILQITMKLDVVSIYPYGEQTDSLNNMNCVMAMIEEGVRNMHINWLLLDE